MLPDMSDAGHNPSDSRSQARQASAAPSPAGPSPAAPDAAATPAPRVQPPLQEVLKGLDTRELEGETVFDQLFGPLPSGAQRPHGA